MRPSQTPECPTLGTTLVGAACLSVQPLILNALSVPALGYIIRRLGPDGYGQWMVATSLLTVCAAVTSLGLRGAFVRTVAADPGSAPMALAEQMGLRVLLAVLAGAAVIAGCMLLRYPTIVLSCTAVGAAGLVLTTIATTLSDVLQAVHRLKTIATVNLVAGIVLTGSSVICAFLGAGPVAIAVVYLTGPALSVALLLAVVGRLCCRVSVRLDVRRCVALLAGSRFFAAQQLLTACGTQAEALMLPRLVGLHQFGFFTAGTLLTTRLAVLPDGMCTAAYPAMVRAFARDRDRGGRLVLWYTAIAACGGVAVALIVSWAADLIGKMLFPGSGAVLSQVARMTVWSLPLVAIDAVLGYALNAAGKDAAQARVSLPAAALSLLCSVLLVTRFGVAGACWSMLARPAVRVAFMTPLAVRTVWPRNVEAPPTPEILIARRASLLRKAG